MSVKIYNAYEIIDIQDVFDFAFKLQTNLRKTVIENIKSSGILEKEYFEAIKTINDAESNPYHDDFSPKAEIMLFKHKDKYYLKTFFDRSRINKNLEDIVLKNKNLKEFEYENSTDELPEGVSRKEYNKRYTIWKKMMYSDFSLKGLVLPISDAKFVCSTIFDLYREKSKNKQ